MRQESTIRDGGPGCAGRAKRCAMEEWNVVDEEGRPVVQCSLEGNRVRVRTGEVRGTLTKPAEGNEEVITLPSRQAAECLAELLRSTSIRGMQRAKAVRVS